jgi:hypothetical protein
LFTLKSEAARGDALQEKALRLIKKMPKNQWVQMVWQKGHT